MATIIPTKHFCLGIVFAKEAERTHKFGHNLFRNEWDSKLLVFVFTNCQCWLLRNEKSFVTAVTTMHSYEEHADRNHLSSTFCWVLVAVASHSIRTLLLTPQKSERCAEKHDGFVANQCHKIQIPNSFKQPQQQHNSPRSSGLPRTRITISR